MKKTLTLFSTLLILGLVSAKQVYAVCPVCTIAVGAGLGISKALGIDDAVTSVWIGGLILSVSFWTIDWLNKKGYFKKIKNTHLNFCVILTWYALTLVPLYFSKLIGLPFNSIWGIDKILFGTAIGSVVFLAAVWLDKRQRQKYGKQFFNYQKVVFPFVSLLITSLILHFLIK